MTARVTTFQIVASWLILGLVVIVAGRAVVAPVVGTIGERIDDLDALADRIVRLEARSTGAPGLEAAAGTIQNRTVAAGVIVEPPPRAAETIARLLAVKIGSAGGPPPKLTPLRQDKAGALTIHRVRLDGEIPNAAIERVLAELEAGRPLVLVDAFQIDTTTDTATSLARISLTLRLFSVEPGSVGP